MDELNSTTDTFSWDTAFAIKLKDVNAAIKNGGASPRTMEQTLDGEAIIKCSFGDWQVGSTGDGNLFHLNIPIKNCTVTFNGKESAPIPEVTAIAEVQLHFYKVKTSKKNSEGVFKHLKVKSSRNNSGDKVVHSVSVDYEGNAVSTLVQALLPDGIKTWLNTNISLFDHIFAIVNLNRKADTGAFEWLLPTSTAYAFSRNENNPEESILGIMCMTENNSPDNLVEELAYNIIPPSSDAGFLISESRLIKKMILPTLPNAFKGLKEEDFGMGEDGKSLHLVSTDKSFCVIYEDKTYNAMLERFDISLQGGKLCLHAETKTEITEGIYAHSIQDHSYQISLYTKADGSQSLRYIECGKPVILNSTSQDNTTTFLEVFYSIIAGIILAVLIAITDGLVLVLVVIIGGLLVGLISTASEIIQLVGTNDAPDISLLVLNCTDPIQWTDKKDFLLNLATLNGPLQLGGFFKT